MKLLRSSRFWLHSKSVWKFFLLLTFLVNACQIKQEPLLGIGSQKLASKTTQEAVEVGLEPISPTPFPIRSVFSPGELVDYSAQSGDTLPVLAERFNTTVANILEANPFIPSDATTMPPGMPMKIPAYYRPLWGPAYLIIPDSLFINGPAQISFDTREFVAKSPGWLSQYKAYASGEMRSGAEIIDVVSRNYSVSPRLLLALLEYQTGALSQPQLNPSLETYPLGYEATDHTGLYLQLNWAANYLNNAYYGWRQGKLFEIELKNGRVERFDPWLNAATVSLHYYFNNLYADPQYSQAIAHDGIAQVYRNLFGDPWVNEQPHIPGSLVQPELILPIPFGEVWAFTGGPHSGWGVDEPLAALDFAPPVMTASCDVAPGWTIAMTSGVVVRSETGQVMLDLDGDGDERTGWNLFYLHVATEDRIALASQVNRGDPLGHPSCEGGRSTGTHIHVARKYNGEWIAAEGVLAFTMEGWKAYNGSESYRGILKRGTQTIIANVNSNSASFIQSDRR